MTLRLDPRYPVLWRSPESAQIGFDPPIAVLHRVTETQSLMLAALAVGVTVPGLALIARGRLPERDRLLAAVQPALLGSEPKAAIGRIALSGNGSLIAEITASLSKNQVLVHRAAEAIDLAKTKAELAVLIHDGVVPPTEHGVWLRRDVAHLPVVFTDGGVIIGPAVNPGAGPCLTCVELHRRDADEAWPMIATQLLDRRNGGYSPVFTLEAIASVSRLVIDHVGGALPAAHSLRIDCRTGERQWREWSPHPDCGCRDVALLLSGSVPSAD